MKIKSSHVENNMKYFLFRNTVLRW